MLRRIALFMVYGSILALSLAPRLLAAEYAHPGGTTAFARWHIVPSSYAPAPFSRELRVFEFGAETSRNPFARALFEASVNTIMRSQPRGGVISSVDYRIGGYYSLGASGLLGRFGLGVSHGSWHNIDRPGRVQVFNYAEVRARL